ncbi:hypothetical protein KVL58_05895 [Helicobacter pylori]|nr:hypothetical protein KVL58_05895 [Helicobacter pylori]
MVLMVSLCGFVVSFWLVKLVWRALVIEFFLVVLGGFLGGYCAHMIIEHYHLSGFFVWVVYALCIFLGAGICGPFYYFWSKWLAKWLPKEHLDSKNKHGINKFVSVVVMDIMVII